MNNSLKHTHIDILKILPVEFYRKLQISNSN